MLHSTKSDLKGGKIESISGLAHDIGLGKRIVYSLFNTISMLANVPQ